ncbi:LysR family transcriptional regulator [Shewanella algae]|uniref:LysR family transcriptional regulator n=1 Tax=Shewanella algae TaxID=38313 RepID=UPI001AAD7B62|nr:LysR family transcriptional regulator [Shewanella algae]MBO2673858.1 LysR family transcriptional regulator [Shewanella algae]
MKTPHSPANLALLDPVLLRAFVAVADSGSFTRAAAATHLTQSTVSQQLRRLEQQLGYPLLDRSGRYAQTTPEGERLLTYARQILALMQEAGGRTQEAFTPLRLGVPEDFAGEVLTQVLAELQRQEPTLQLELTSGLSQGLYEAFRDGKLDIVLVKQRLGASRGVACWPEPVCWFDSRSHSLAEKRPLPLVAFPNGGLYRSEMIQLLDEAGIEWQMVQVSNSLSQVKAAVAAGIGVSLLPKRLLTDAHIQQETLPPPLPMELVLHASPSLNHMGKRLIQALVARCNDLMVT